MLRGVSISESVGQLESCSRAYSLFGNVFADIQPTAETFRSPSLIEFFELLGCANLYSNINTRLQEVVLV